MLPVMSNKIAVYTAVFDGYDIVQPPKVIPCNVGFYCFTNLSSGIRAPWKIINYQKPADYTSKMASARLKILGHEIFDTYDFTVWIDANILLKGDIQQLVYQCMIRSDLSVNQHQSRDCIYDEAGACIQLGKSDAVRTTEQMNRYRSEGYPAHYGLSETTVLIRSSKSELVKQTQDIWWNEFLNGGHRDQLCLDYARWRTGIRFSDLGHDYFGKSGFFFKFPHVPRLLRGKCTDGWNKIAALAYSDDRWKKSLLRVLLALISRLSKL